MNGPTELEKQLISWFEGNARELPWRSRDRTPWQVLVSEIMLQQTPVSRVHPVWTQWLDRWPCPADLATASPAEVIRAWQRLGYPRRALRLREAAIKITSDFGGEVPDTYKGLRSLPGVGDYTAAAILAFAFSQRAIVLDTNVRRVLARVSTGSARPESAAPTTAERQLAQSLLPLEPRRAARWSIAVMELGALVCRSRTPVCDQCPVATSCRWRSLGHPEHEQIKQRGQTFTGTDRQARGRIMAALRESNSPLARADLEPVWPQDQAQRDRALHTLIVDGLVEPLPSDHFALPGG